MRAVALWIACLGLLAGCKSQPSLEPAKQPEVMSVPPMTDNRYTTPTYPKEAFNTQDPMRRRDLDPNNDILPTRGNMGGIGGPGGMGGMNRPY